MAVSLPETCGSTHGTDDSTGPPRQNRRGISTGFSLTHPCPDLNSIEVWEGAESGPSPRANPKCWADAGAGTTRAPVSVRFQSTGAIAAAPRAAGKGRMMRKRSLFALSAAGLLGPAALASAQAVPRVIYSEIAASPTSAVPGVPGVIFESFDRMYSSPS